MVLIGYWPLNESSGSTAYDYTGNANHGSVSGAGPTGTGVVSGPLGSSAYLFDGSDDGIDFTDSEVSNQVSSQVSVSAWVKPSQVQDAWNVISMRKGRDIYLNYTENTLKPKFAVTTSSSSSVANSSDKTPSDSWSHVTGVYDRKSVKLYLDGVLQESSGLTGDLENPGNKFTAGYEPGNPYEFNGAIAELRIYNHALTPQEVQYLFTASSRGRSILPTKST